MSELSDRVGEVIEASTTEFVAECYELYELPPLGSLVSVGDTDEKTYGIVYHATTASVEPGRRPIARGKDEVSEEGIYKSSPQLEKLLRSEFSALVVGHGNNKIINQYLPSKPARIHGFVFLCPPEQVRDFSQSLDFLNLLLNTTLPVSVEELIAATLRQMGQSQDDKQAFLKTAGRELAVLLSGEFSRLRAILGRIATA
jgi:hypothetical protein